MRSLIILVASTTVISGLADATPGFSVDFRSFGGSPVFPEQRLPDRGQTRSFRESSGPPASPQQQLQAFRDEPFREFRPSSFGGREETRIFHEETRGGFPGDTRVFKDDNRDPFKDELRNFADDARPFRDETRIFKDEIRGFRDDTRTFRDERPFAAETRPFRDGPRHFRDERPFRDERKPFREEIRPYRDDFRSFRDEARPMREEFRNFDGPGSFRGEMRPFKNEPSHFGDNRPYSEDSGPLKGNRPFKDESGPFRNELRPFREESGPFRNEARPFGGESGPFRNQEAKPFREESGLFRNEARPFRDEIQGIHFGDSSGQMKNAGRPFKDETGPVRSEPRPFRDEPQPFKDELLFTQESQSLAEAQHRFNKEQEQRQPLSFGGHSSYLKYGNHGLGFASVPAAVLPLEDGTTQRVSDMTVSEFAQTAATQSPGASSSSSPSLRDNTSNSKSQISVTLAPEIGSTQSQSPSGKTIDSNTVSGERKNEKLAGEASTSSQASAAVTISTSGGTNVTPKVVFGSGSGSTSNTPMRITSADNGNGSSGTGVHQANAASALHASKSSMHPSDASTTSYFTTSDASSEIPAALLNYIFKYQTTPQDAKVRYVLRPVATESSNHIQTSSPLVHHHHQTAKYGILPEFKIPTLSAIQQPEGAINYVSTAGLPKVSYLNANSPGLALGASYSADSVPAVNFPRNLIQLDQGVLAQFGQSAQLQSQLQQIQQADQYPQFRQLTTSANANPLVQYGQFGQTEQTRSNPFNQGGLQLQLGGFGGIDYSALTGNSDASRVSQSASLGIAKVGLSFPEPTRPPLPTITKVFSESLW